ncbi:formylmethionine deformylase-like protein [Diplodia corticola]|uniref:Formylmethionine deformylase-like protein n=1 Tax=Diplodia corticola TaxID=236234 RepID=A0A1J9SH45_9PEZI|nr:formylmethionine deformylase-like protein [Diplodia corticola]OJD38901.1 formylmethionine deformylase-like protein [Diplodia corticola]
MSFLQTRNPLEPRQTDPNNSPVLNISATWSESSKEPRVSSRGTEESKNPLRHNSQKPWEHHFEAPLFMVMLLVVGIAVSIGHHFFYHWLSGQEVQSADRQQWALRIGNAFAFLAKCCFCSAANFAFTQWLWKTLRAKFITIQVGRCSQESKLEQCWQLLHGKLTSDHVHRKATYTVVRRCIPLITLVTPATLSVKADLAQSPVVTDVPVPLAPQDIIPLKELLSIWVKTQGVIVHSDITIGNHRVAEEFKKLTLSSAIFGQLFSLPQPFTDADSSYTVDFVAPGIKCDNSSHALFRDVTVAALRSQGYSTKVDSHDSHFLNVSRINFDELEYSHGQSRTQIGYFARIPGANDDAMDFGLANGTRNEIHIVVAGHTPTTHATVPTFLTCQLWNVSRTANISTTNGVQSVQVTGTKLLNKFDRAFQPLYPEDVEKDTFATEEVFYTAFFLGMAKRLLGFIGTTKIQDSVVSDPPASIQETVLTSSTEYVAMARNISTYYSSSSAIDSDRPLAMMIEELAQNISLNLMTRDFFSKRVPWNVTRVDRITVYTYDPRNLLLAYGIATVSTFLMVCAGFFAYRSNGASYSSAVSTFICTTQNPDIKDIISDQTSGAQPLPADIAKTKLRFGIVKRRETGGGMLSQRGWTETIGFGVEGTVGALSPL